MTKFKRKTSANCYAKLRTVFRLVVSVAICFCAGGIGAIFTGTEAINSWYGQLQKPFFNPPEWVFGPVWTVLYLMMGISAFIVWNRGTERVEVRRALRWFFVQLVLNAIWTPLFFGLHLILAAFIEIILLWLAILVTVFAFRRVSLFAAVVLIPYLVWVGFAAVLTGSIWYLNYSN